MKDLAKIEIKWGVVFFLMTLLWMAFEKVMGWHAEKIHLHASLTNLYALPAIAVYVFALRDKRKSLPDGKMTWLKGFLSGLIITLVVFILTPLGQYITHSFISPEYFSNVSNYAVEEMGKKRADMDAYFNLRNYMLLSLGSAAIMGIVTSAVVALFLRSK